MGRPIVWDELRKAIVELQVGEMLVQELEDQEHAVTCQTTASTYGKRINMVIRTVSHKGTLYIIRVE